MTKGKAVAIAALVGVLSATGVTAASAVAKAPGAGELSATEIDDYVRDYAERTGLPGALVTVTKGDQVVHVAGYGHMAGSETVTKDTPMPRAWVSKSFTVLAVLHRADQRKISLDAPYRSICLSSPTSRSVFSAGDWGGDDDGDVGGCVVGAIAVRGVPGEGQHVAGLDTAEIVCRCSIVPGCLASQLSRAGGRSRSMGVVMACSRSRPRNRAFCSRRR
ncbi:serine hydrolase domain-containing protein [Nonomuraea sp. NPDC005983]|uniref:serine hydrolase domain-containing protein n=1 Tax=Nonomuraea sp. NPDC005983 TaxID=3155595 RepID=UPI0033BDD6D7